MSFALSKSEFFEFLLTCKIIGRIRLTDIIPYFKEFNKIISNFLGSILNLTIQQFTYWFEWISFFIFRLQDRGTSRSVDLSTFVLSRLVSELGTYRQYALTADGYAIRSTLRTCVPVNLSK